jgi:hypothetical protein
MASRTELRVLFNGDEAEFAYHPGELVSKLLQRAIDRFHIINNPHTYSLFTKAGHELPDDSHLKKAGVKQGDLLLLRPSEVKGG